MIFGSEHQQSRFKIEFSGAGFLRRDCVGLGAVKSHDALAAEAGLVPQFRRDLREQGVGDFHMRAPARTFVGVGRAELAIVRLATQRAATVIGWIHWFCSKPG